MKVLNSGITFSDYKSHSTAFLNSAIALAALYGHNVVF